MSLVSGPSAGRGPTTRYSRAKAVGAVLTVLGAAASAACSPTFNWRSVPVGDGGLIALLPCKPDRATREMQVGTGGVASVDMAGCETGGATFAIAHTLAADAAQAASWLDAWQRALQAQPSAAGATQTPAQVARAARSPAPVRLDTVAPGPDDGGPGTHVLWFAQLRGGQVSLYQATVVGRPASGDAVATFFDGLQLP